MKKEIIVVDGVEIASYMRDGQPDDVVHLVGLAAERADRERLKNG